MVGISKELYDSRVDKPRGGYVRDLLKETEKTVGQSRFGVETGDESEGFRKTVRPLSILDSPLAQQYGHLWVTPITTSTENSNNFLSIKCIMTSLVAIIFTQPFVCCSGYLLSSMLSPPFERFKRSNVHVLRIIHSSGQS